MKRNVVFNADINANESEIAFAEFDGVRTNREEYQSRPGIVHLWWIVEESYWHHLPNLRSELVKRLGDRWLESWISVLSTADVHAGPMVTLGLSSNARVNIEGPQGTRLVRCIECRRSAREPDSFENSMLQPWNSRQHIAYFGRFATVAVAQPLLDALMEAELTHGLRVEEIAHQGPSPFRWHVFVDGPRLGAIEAPYGHLTFCSTCGRCVPKYGFFPVCRSPDPTPDWAWSTPRRLMTPYVSARVFGFLESYLRRTKSDIQLDGSLLGWLETDRGRAFLPPKFQDTSGDVR